MKKRILTVLLAVCLVFALGTVTALAADEGFPDAGENGVISLTKDITITGNQTLDLSTNSVETNGYSITVTGSLTVTGTGKVTNNVAPDNSDGKTDVKGIFIVEGGTLTIQQGTFETAGAEIIRVNSGTANVNGGTFKCTATDVSSFNERVMFLVTGVNSKLNFSAGTIDADGLGGSSGHGLYGVYPANGAAVVLGSAGGGNEPEIYTDFSAIALNNTTSDPATTVTINSGYYKSGLNGGSALKENCVIYLPGECNFVINGGTFVTADTNANVISIPYPGFNVDLSINGGTFNASTGNAVIKTWGVGLPAADSNEPNIISIADGEFISGNTFADFDSKEVHDDFITGGTFSNVNDTNFDSYLAPGLEIDEDGDVVVGDDAVAQVGDTVYTDLQEAINAAQRGTTKTVTLLKDVSVSAAGFVNNQGAITITEDIILDGDTHTISITSIDTGATPSAINIQNSANVTLKDLTIDSNGAKHGLNINNNATVNLEDVEIMNSDWYAVVCNSSKLTVDGLYTHGNEWGINIDSKTANVKSDVTITDAYITESDSIVFENTKGAGSEVEINGGTFNVIKRQGDNQNNVIIDVNGGTFGTSIVRIANTYPNYQVEVGGDYSYYNNADDALDAAGTTGEVTYVGRTTNTHDVTLYYGKGHVVELEVADDEVIYLPSGSFNGKPIAGWTERYAGDYKPGAKVVVDRNMYFTVVLKDGEFDIVIDSKIEHGDISTNVNSADKGDTVYIYVDPDTGYVLDDIDVYYGLNYRYSVKVSYVRNNTYRFEMPNADVYITATFKANGMPFVDVHRTQWFYDSIYYVWSNDMMEGDSATTFNPDGTMTRAMFWAVLGRMDGQTITGTNWVEQARNWAMREGVSDGTNPNDYVTREQMVTMLWRYAGEKNGSANLNRYTDSGSVSGYAVEAMRWAIGNGVIQGVTSTTLAPKANATRAECATIFMRFDKM